MAQPANDTIFLYDSESGEEFRCDDSDDLWSDFEGDGDLDLDLYRHFLQNHSDVASEESEIDCQQARPGPSNSRSRPASTSTAPPEFEWESYDFLDPYESVWLGDFMETPGPTLPTAGFSPQGFFALLFPAAVISLIVRETNAYAEATLAARGDTYYCQRWKPTSEVEIRAYIALQIAMGLNPRPSIDDYWTSFWLLESKFSDVMTRHRYKMLSAFLHFSSNDQIRRRGEEGYDPLGKIRPLLNATAHLNSEVYYPHRQLSIDESMAPFKGRCHFRQYMPDKPTKRGFKVFCICDSTNRYCLDYAIYTGKSDFEIPRGSTFTDHLVSSLMEAYVGKNHVLFTDNFCTSPALFNKLQQVSTGAVGTLLENRKGFPQQLKKKNLTLKKGDDPVFSRAGDLVCVAWHDTKRVNLLSTVHTDNTIDKRVRARDAPGGHRTVEKPVIADAYNSYMGGVNHFDQLIKNYYYPHRSYKWYMALFHFVKEMALVNSFIMHKMQGHKLSQKDFRISIINTWVKPYMDQRKARKQAQPNLVVARLSARNSNHFPAKYEDKKFRPVCKVCASIKKRSQTRFFCLGCNVPLCIEGCFTIYHTEDNIMEARRTLEVSSS